MDTWWQTETGMFMITPTPVVPLKPGSGTRPFFGQEAEIVDEEGKPGGRWRRRLPGAQESLAGHAAHHLRRRRALRAPILEQIPRQVHDRRLGPRDKDGYFWIIGRVDDVIKVSGHRLGTAEVESALITPPGRGGSGRHRPAARSQRARPSTPSSFCAQGSRPPQDLAEELRQHVATHMGPIARPEEVKFVDKLPKTRSGKIMRRVLKARAQGLPEGDVSTLEE